MTEAVKSIIDRLQDAHYEILLELTDSVDELETVLRSASGEALVERAIEIRDLRVALEAVVNTINYLEIKNK
jgi:flagellar biosynthesis component FlhA